MAEPKIMVQVEYEIKKETRDFYFDWCKRIKKHLLIEYGIQHNVFEKLADYNYFTEWYLCESLDDYNRLEENSDERLINLIDEIACFVVDPERIKVTIFSEILT